MTNQHPPRLLLLVDDDDDIREVTRASLELVGGFRIVTASSGPEALRQAREHRPDGILLDMMMPGMDGLQTLEKLEDDEAVGSIPIIVLTARVDGFHEASPNVVGVIRKPFDPMGLGTEVSKLLGWAS